MDGHLGTQLIWKPKTEVPATSLARLREHFPRPARAMGEAWFMGSERKLYSSLLAAAGLSATNPELESACETLASGPLCFGPRHEWTEWLHYLLSRLPDFADTRWAPTLFELLATAVMARYPEGCVEAPYDLFFEDLLLVFGATLTRDIESVLVGSEDVSERQLITAGSAFSSALFLTAKYASDESLSPWWKSVVEIENPIWRARLLLWLAAASPIFLKPSPRIASLDSDHNYGAGWGGSNSLGRHYPTESGTDRVVPFLPAARQQSMLACFRETMTADRILEWNVDFQLAATCIEDPIVIESQLQDALDRCVADYGLQAS
jgi:hypothetical protein